MKAKKIISILMCAAMLVPMAGCKKNETADNSKTDIPILGKLGNEVSDSSDMPDWEGKKLKLSYWDASQFNSPSMGKKAEQDVVTPEIVRVTGVQFDPDNSIDNGGESMEAKVAKISASDSWPNVIHFGQKAIIDKLGDADMVYDLAPYMDEYCPNIVSMLKKTGTYDFVKNQRSDGKVLRLPYIPGSYEFAYPEMESEQLAKVSGGYQTRNHVWVRDDILKMVYPNAKTQAEIEDLYVKNGKFSEEDLTDVTFKSKDEYFGFLKKVKELNIKEGAQPVYPSYIYCGTDNWQVLGLMGALYGQNANNGNDTNYFTYWDKEKKHLEYKFKQPFFKDMLKDWTQLVRDDVLSKESMLDNRSVFEQKRDNGLYAVVYANDTPKNNVIKSAGKPYQYRKVFIDIAPDEDKYLFTNGIPLFDDFSVIKKGLSESDLKQILVFYDYMMSDAGLKLSVWGPKSAGLFEEKDGKRVYKDKELEACMIYDDTNERNVYYNLNKGGLTAWPGYPLTDINKFNPKFDYDIERQTNQANRAFSLSEYRPLARINSIPPDIYRIDNDNAKRFWQSRTAFEDAIYKIYVTKNDGEFESAYNAMVELAQRNGLTDEALEGIHNDYINVLNKGFSDNLK